MELEQPNSSSFRVKLDEMVLKAQQQREDLTKQDDALFERIKLLFDDACATLKDAKIEYNNSISWKVLKSANNGMRSLALRVAKTGDDVFRFSLVRNMGEIKITIGDIIFDDHRSDDDIIHDVETQLSSLVYRLSLHNGSLTSFY